MRSEVHDTQLPLHSPNLCDELLDLCLGNGACGEEGIELAFLLKEVGAQAYRLRPHCLKYALGFLALLGRSWRGSARSSTCLGPG
jgi:hypothetical protein